MYGEPAVSGFAKRHFGFASRIRASFFFFFFSKKVMRALFFRVLIESSAHVERFQESLAIACRRSKFSSMRDFLRYFMHYSYIYILSIRLRVRVRAEIFFARYIICKADISAGPVAQFYLMCISRRQKYIDGSERIRIHEIYIRMISRDFYFQISRSSRGDRFIYASCNVRSFQATRMCI